jgi:UTP--glucose-1-phosphate uridylyltransferase
MKIKKAVIPVAGLGTRFLPATKAVPKELLPIVDVPAIQYVVEEAVAAGITEIIFVTGRNKSGIEDYFDADPELEQVLEKRGHAEMLATLRRIATMIEVVSVRQKYPLGLGHAVLCARDLVGDEPFAVLLSDDVVDAPVPCTAQLNEIFAARGESVIALRRVPKEEVRRYGIVGGNKVAERVYEMETMVEKPEPSEAPSEMAIIGRYLLRPEIFPLLEKLPRGRGGEIQLTDGIAGLAKSRRVYGYEFAGDHYDVGAQSGFVAANLAFALKRTELRRELEEHLRRVFSTT